MNRTLNEIYAEPVADKSRFIITMNYFVLNLTLRPPQREKHPSGLSVKTLSQFSDYISKIIEWYGCAYFSLKEDDHFQFIIYA